MALPIARFLIQGEDQSGKAFKSATEASAKFGENAAKGALKAIAGFAGVALSVEGVARVLEQSIRKYAEAEATEIRFAVAARNNPAISGVAAKNLQAYISTQIKSTIYSKEQLGTMVTTLIQQGRNEQQIKMITKASIELAAATGEDLNSATEKVAMTFSGTARELARLYPVIGRMTEADLQAGKAAWYLAQANAGVAEAIAGSMGGKIQQMKNAVEETMQSLGGAIAPLLTKALDAIKPMIEKIGTWIQNNTQRIGNFFTHIPQLAKLAFDMLLDIVVNYITELPTIIKNVAIALFHFQIDLWKLQLQMMIDIAKLVFALIWEPLKFGFQTAIFWLKKLWVDFLGILASLGNETIVPLFNSILSGIQNVINGVIDMINHLRTAIGLSKVGAIPSIQIQQMAQLKVTQSAEKAPVFAAETWKNAVKDALSTTFNDAWKGVQKEFQDAVALAKAAGKPFEEVWPQYQAKIMAILNEGLDIGRTQLDIDKGKIPATGPYSIQNAIMHLGVVTQAGLFKITEQHLNPMRTGQVTGTNVALDISQTGIGQLAANPLAAIFGSLSTFATAISAVTLLLDPLQTIFAAMFKVITPLVNQLLAPLVGFFTILGNTLGKILIPIIQLLSPILELVSYALLFLYNYAILPVANAIMFVANLFYDIVATIWNAIANAINAVLGWLGVHVNTMETRSLTQGFLTPITMAQMAATGQAAEAGAGGTGATAQYTGQQAIIVNIQNNFGTASIVGIENFVAEIMRDIQAANATNQGVA